MRANSRWLGDTEDPWELLLLAILHQAHDDVQKGPKRIAGSPGAREYWYQDAKRFLEYLQQEIER